MEHWKWFVQSDVTLIPFWECEGQLSNNRDTAVKNAFHKNNKKIEIGTLVDTNRGTGTYAGFYHGKNYIFNGCDMFCVENITLIYPELSPHWRWFSEVEASLTFEDPYWFCSTDISTYQASSRDAAVKGLYDQFYSVDKNTLRGTWVEGERYGKRVKRQFAGIINGEVYVYGEVDNSILLKLTHVRLCP